MRNRSRTASASRSESTIRDETPSNAIEVIVRMRPILEPYEDEIVWEIDQETNSIQSKIDNFDVRNLNVSHPKFYVEFANAQKFFYDDIQGTDSRTKDIYNNKLRKIVDNVLHGYNGTIFMYGQTTSGKTYTMLGTQKDPGILPHSLRTIFMQIPKMKDYQFTISVSYLEIYNEIVNDLLSPGSSGLKVNDDPKFGVLVKGLKVQEVSSFEDAIYLMSYGEEHRKYRETNVNEHSSRSHTIYQVYVESFEETPEGKMRRFSCLNLVDLAGSESLQEGGGGESLRETGHINKSLFCLTNVIKKLADGKVSHIPYRDSKLTRILSNAIGGNSLTTVVCAISPALQNYGQTLSTLRFASRAKKVKNAAMENFVQEGADPKLKEQLRVLTEKLHQSQHQVQRVNTLNSQLEDNLQLTKQEVRGLQKEMEELKNMFIKESTRHIDDNMSNSSLLDIMNEDLPQNFKPSSGKKNTMTSYLTSQPNEIFFGDPILGMVEQVIAESSESVTNVSIENPLLENSNSKEWSSLCLKAKYTYLKELKNLQKNFVSSLEEVSQKFITKEQNTELGAQIKGYVAGEFQKIDTIQSKISEHVKKINPNSSKELWTEKNETQDSERRFEEWLPRGQFGEEISSFKQIETKSANTGHHYADVLDRLEKKYDEIYNLVTQSLPKVKDDSFDTSQNPILAKKYSFDSSICTSPIDPNLSTDNVLGGDLNSPLKSPGDPKKSRFYSEERPSATGKAIPKFTSTFAKLRTEREKRGASLTELSTYGNAYLWGSGKDGRLGNGKSTNEGVPNLIRDLRFSKVVCGYHNTFGISQEGLVYGWGRNENGQLGIGTNMNAPFPTNVTNFNKITIVDIACGWQHCLALSIEGLLYSWGCGDEGQLGHGDNFDLTNPAEVKFFEKTQVVKIACGHSQSAAITTEGSLYTWGYNADYRLMNSNPKSHYIPTLTELYKAKTEVANEADLEIISLSLGATHMCVVTNNGSVFAAGRGHEGQLGKRLIKYDKNVCLYKPEEEMGNVPSEEILCSYFTQVEPFGVYNRALMVSCGEKFTLVLTDENKVYSFGDASDGCLGQEYEENEKCVFQPRMVESLADIQVKSIVAGPRHAACISETEELYCWGFNYYDQQEIGITEKEYHKPKKIDKISKQSVIAVSCGYFHTASLIK